MTNSHAALGLQSHIQNALIAFRNQENFSLFENKHCVKSVQIRSYFWSLFSCIQNEYGHLLSKSPYSVRIQENTDQK